MPSVYQPRRPRASPLWQLVHHGWAAILAHYEKRYRKDLGPLHPAATATVESILRCGDLASGFTRLQCPDCDHERLLAFTCKGRHFCPSCHQRRVRSTSDWIATAVCHEVPQRQFVFTIPKVLRGIFRKRRQLLTHLFHTATGTLQQIFRARLNLPDGKLGAIAAVHTFGDYLIFHPHLHVLAADGLFTPDGRFHCMPAEDLAPAIELFRHRFLHRFLHRRLRPSTSTPWSLSNHLGRRSRNGSPTKNLISTGSTIPGILQIPIPTDSTKVPHGNPRKSNSTTAAP